MEHTNETYKPHVLKCLSCFSGCIIWVRLLYCYIFIIFKLKDFIPGRSKLACYQYIMILFFFFLFFCFVPLNDPCLLKLILYSVLNSLNWTKILNLYSEIRHQTSIPICLWVSLLLTHWNVSSLCNLYYRTVKSIKPNYL